MREPNHTLSLPCNVRAEEPWPRPNLWRSIVESTEFKRFDPAESHALNSVGWDAWAEEYARLPRLNSTYRFSKRLLYRVIEDELRWSDPLDVLDFNCGCGNDFAHFLDAGHRVVGCDGSAGMLSVAARRHKAAVSDGTVVLYYGQAEALTADAFGGRRFDAIISATGGTAYLTDHQLQRVHATFAALLRPGGRMIITHLVPRCLIESLYHLLHARPRSALRRWRTKVEISVRSEPLTMYLRSARDLERILSEVAPADRLVPLNVVTPPFQTGFQLPDRLAGVMNWAEHKLQRYRACLSACDQVAWITRAV